MNYTYILKCKDGTLYTGWTTDLDRRVRMHNSGKGAKYTRGRRPVELVYYEEHETRQEAMQRECAIKKMSRKEKVAMIARKQEAPRCQSRERDPEKKISYAIN